MINTGPCGDVSARTRAGVVAPLAALLTAIAACHAPPQRAAVPAVAVPADSYDWHGLLIVPFGSVLKDIPLRLHEVLLFRDEARDVAPTDSTAADAECYAADGPAPRFLGRAPDEYLLCFKHDRLSRIQASVRLPPAQAGDVFTAACAQWLKNAAALPVGTACEGRDGAIHFTGRIDAESSEAELPPTEKSVSISLDSAPDPTAARP